MSEIGPSRHFAAARQFGRFRTEAEIRAGFYEHAAYEPPLISARIFLISARKPGAMSWRASA